MSSVNSSRFLFLVSLCTDCRELSVDREPDFSRECTSQITNRIENRPLLREGLPLLASPPSSPPLPLSPPWPPASLPPVGVAAAVPPPSVRPSFSRSPRRSPPARRRRPSPDRSPPCQFHPRHHSSSLSPSARRRFPAVLSSHAPNRGGSGGFSHFSMFVILTLVILRILSSAQFFSKRLQEVPSVLETSRSVRWDMPRDNSVSEGAGICILPFLAQKSSVVNWPSL